MGRLILFRKRLLEHQTLYYSHSKSRNRFARFKTITIFAQMTVSIERNCASRIGRVGIPDGCWHDLIFFNLILNQMKITDNTNQKSDNRTFNVGDVVKAVFDGKQTTFVLIVQTADYNCHAVQIKNGEVWNNKVQCGSTYTFEQSLWHYTKVNAELIITD